MSERLRPEGMNFSSGEGGGGRIPPRKRLAGIADQTIDVRNTPELAINDAHDMESFIGRIGALRHITLDNGEVREGWQIARLIERVERGEFGAEILPSVLGIRDKYKKLKQL